VLLPGLVALAAGVQVLLGRRTTLPRVFGDELIYAGLGKSIATAGRLLLRGHETFGYSILYPVVISPAYALAHDGASAYAAIKYGNAIAMASAAIPAYLIARRVLSHEWSVGVAAGTVLMPWMGYSTVVMTEPFFYPLFLWFAFAFVLALEHPTLTRQLAALGALGLLTLVRPQGAALALGVAIAIALDAVTAARSRARLASFWPMWLVLGCAAIAVIAVRAAGRHPLGAYDVLARGYSLVALAKWSLWTAADFELALGVAAFVVAPLALRRLLRRGSSPAERALGCASVGLVLALFASVVVISASPYGLDRLHERNLFYVVPLLLISFAYWLQDGARRAGPRVGGMIAGVALALAVSVPDRLVISQGFDSPGIRPLGQLHGTVDAHGPDVPVRVLAVVCVLVGLAVVASRIHVLALATVVVAFSAATWLYPRDTHFPRSQVSKLAWVDRSLPDGVQATLVDASVRPACKPREGHEAGGVGVDTEFLNIAVRRVGVLFGNDFGEVAADRLLLGPGGTVLDRDAPISPRYVVIDSQLPVVGTPLARFTTDDLSGVDLETETRLTLWRAASPLRLEPAAVAALCPQ
jgi:hypothetical protein